jgi:ribosomal protein L7/L12
MLAALDAVGVAAFAAIVALYAIVSGLGRSLAGARRQSQRVEQKVDAILAHLGIDATAFPVAGDLPAEVRELANNGEKIAAIKRHRELTGCGLKEAKDAVEAYLDR